MASTRKCTSGRVLADRDIMDPYVTEFLRRVGWENWIDAPEAVHYPSLAKEFYQNMNIMYRNNNKYDPLLSSNVQGIPIHLSMNDISEIFHIPNEGECIFFPRKWKDNDLQISLAECQQTMLSCPYFIPGIIPTEVLKYEFKCLFTYVRANVVPVSGHNDEIGKYPLFIMYCMVVGRKLNLPYIIINLMKDTKKQKKKNYIFTSMLNKVFRRNNVVLNIQYDQENSSTPIGHSTLNQFASHPVGHRTPTHSVPPNVSDEANTNDFYQPHTNIYPSMPPEEQIYYATQELNSDFDFVNPTEGSSVTHSAPQTYAPANWSNWSNWPDH